MDVNCSRRSKVDDQTLQRRCVGLSMLFQRCANVTYIHVVILSITRCCKNVVLIDETSWLDCRCDYNVAWMSTLHVLITLINRRWVWLSTSFQCCGDIKCPPPCDVDDQTLRKRCICVVRCCNVYTTNNQRRTNVVCRLGMMVISNIYKMI